jgi:hypothetical protein
MVVANNNHKRAGALHRGIDRAQVDLGDSGALGMGASRCAPRLAVRFQTAFQSMFVPANRRIGDERA